MPLPSDLLNPISPEKPCGDDLLYSPIFDKIKEARREDDDVPQGDWARGRKTADWPLTIKLINEALSTKTKDLQLTAWLAEAMLRREGINGLREVLDFDRGLIETYWDTLYPELEDGDAEFRAGKLQWVGDKLELAVKGVSLTRSGLTWIRFKESRSVPTEEAAGESEDKQLQRAGLLAEGKLAPEDFDRDFDATPKTFYVNLEALFDTCLESLAQLGEVCDARFGNDSPSFSALRNVLEEVRGTVHSLLQRKREKEPDEPVAEPEPAAEEAAEDAASSWGKPAVAAAPARVPVRKGGALSAEPVDRDDAVARIVACAKFLRQQDTYSPAPYLLLRGLRWGELRASGEQIDETTLAPPPTEIRQKLKACALEYNWTEVLEAAETAMGMECGRGWLDLQRYAARACMELGSYYDPIRNAIVSGLRALLADYPALPDLTMMDDTPTANAETRAWLQETVLVAAAAAPPAQDPWYTSEPEAAHASAGEPLPPDVFQLAMEAARGGRPQEGIELLMRELGQERSGRGRFNRKVQLSQLCVSTGHDNIALPMLQDLAAEIERRKLEDWEASDLVASPLALLYQCLGKNGDAELRTKLYSWICRLDPLKALSVSR
ncbi:MAG: type VI secretion system protein TssA [Candidatus Solibacter sp.]